MEAERKQGRGDEGEKLILEVLHGEGVHKSFLFSFSRAFCFLTNKVVIRTSEAMFNDIKSQLTENLPLQSYLYFARPVKIALSSNIHHSISFFFLSCFVLFCYSCKSISYSNKYHNSLPSPKILQTADL